MPDGNDVQPNAESPHGARTSNDAYRPLIRNRLRHLVSAGTAEFYDDACKQMDMNPPLPTATHTVGHLLREIESSLRGGEIAPQRAVLLANMIRVASASSTNR